MSAFIQTKYSSNAGALLLFVIISILITSFLFYIDEGYYNFNWTTDPGNWIAFLIYALPMFSLQVLVYEKFPFKSSPSLKIILSIIFGIGIAIATVIGFFYLLGVL